MMEWIFVIAVTVLLVIAFKAGKPACGKSRKLHGSCFLKHGHKGSCLFKCAGEYCPGYTFPDSYFKHPSGCITGHNRGRKANPPTDTED